MLRFLSIMAKREAPPIFQTEAEERAFWETHDSASHIDWSQARPVRLPNLKPSSTAISTRRPSGLLERIRIAANTRDVPNASLIKTWLSETIEASKRQIEPRTAFAGRWQLERDKPRPNR